MLSDVGLLRNWLGVRHNWLRQSNVSHWRARSLWDDLCSRYDGLGCVIIRVLIVFLLMMMVFVALHNQSGLVPQDYLASATLANAVYCS